MSTKMRWSLLQQRDRSIRGRAQEREESLTKDNLALLRVLSEAEEEQFRRAEVATKGTGYWRVVLSLKRAALKRGLSDKQRKYLMSLAGRYQEPNA